MLRGSSWPTARLAQSSTWSRHDLLARRQDACPPPSSSWRCSSGSCRISSGTRAGPAPRPLERAGRPRAKLLEALNEKGFGSDHNRDAAHPRRREGDLFRHCSRVCGTPCHTHPRAERRNHRGARGSLQRGLQGFLAFRALPLCEAKACETRPGPAQTHARPQVRRHRPCGEGPRRSAEDRKPSWPQREALSTQS
jgi:hypothetical protein